MDSQHHKIFMEAKICSYDAQFLTNHRAETHALIILKGAKDELATFYFQPEGSPPIPPEKVGSLYKGYFPLSAFEACMKILQDQGTKYFEVTDSEPLNLRIIVQRNL